MVEGGEPLTLEQVVFDLPSAMPDDSPPQPPSGGFPRKR